MMQNQKTLMAMILLALVTTGLLLQMPEQSGPRNQEKVFPELLLDDITRVELEKGDARVSLVKSETGWLVEQKSGYPADFETLSALLVRLSELRIAERKTAKLENHARLGVADSGEGAGTRLTLWPDGQELIVGETSASRGNYLRYADDPQVFLSHESIELDVDVLSWLDPVIVDVESSSVRQVTIATEGAQYLSAIWDEATGGLQLQGVPGDRELRYDGVADSLGRLLVNLRFLDVEPYMDGFFIDPTITRVALEDGSTVEVQSVQSGEDYWLHVSTGGDSNWQYQINQATFRDLNQSMEDMLKAPEEEP